MTELEWRCCPGFSGYGCVETHPSYQHDLKETPPFKGPPMQGPPMFGGPPSPAVKAGPWGRNPYARGHFGPPRSYTHPSFEPEPLPEPMPEPPEPHHPGPEQEHEEGLSQGAAEESPEEEHPPPPPPGADREKTGGWCTPWEYRCFFKLLIFFFTFFYFQAKL